MIHVHAESICSWSEFVRRATDEFKAGWYFRGCLDNHSLESSLERATTHWGVNRAELPEIEIRLLRDFKRAFPSRADVKAPPKEEDLDWLALMQHHGAPTRLLDWAYSPFVAAFFAPEMLLKSPPEEDRMAAIWALSGNPVSNNAIKNMIPAGYLGAQFERYSAKREGSSFRTVFIEAKPPVLFAAPVNPYKLNERLIVQRGLFLCPGDISKPFETNLAAVPTATNPANLKKLLLPRSVMSDAFASLCQMNISAASLFPGIDGYARSQHHTLDFLRSVRLFDGTEY